MRLDRNKVLLLMASSFSVGLSSASIVYQLVPNHATSIVFSIVAAIAGLQLVEGIRVVREIRQLRRELYVQLEEQITAFKAQMEADGFNPIFIASTVLELREKLEELIKR